ncbi:MAG: aldo/keto reductase [Eubacterium sp.]|nr:aldo/keto reductase [Eubacterium sp.]
MDIMKPTAVIGTNAWGGKLYGKAMRGSYVEDEVIRNAMKTAKEQDICIYDLARDYGLGKAEKMIGEFGTKDIFLSAKYTPFTHYKPGCVRKSLMKDLRDFKRHDITVPQVAMAFCSTKGVVPMCGCRKPEQVEELAQAARIRLTKGEVRRLEEAADKVDVKIMGADLFRPFVLKERKRK